MYPIGGAVIVTLYGNGGVHGVIGGGEWGSGGGNAGAVFGGGVNGHGDSGSGCAS